MWQIAVEAPGGQDAQTAIILGVIGLLTAVFVAIIGGLFSLRSNRTAPSPPPSVPDHSAERILAERVAVLEHRAQDSDERDDIQDHRLDALERAQDDDQP